MTLPHQDYYDLWEQTLFDMGSASGRCPTFEMWPRGGLSPLWWDDRWEDSWPFDKLLSDYNDISTTGSKRRKSPDSDSMDVDLDRTPTGDRVPSASTAKWLRLQPVDESNLFQREAWVLVKDGGLMADRKGKNPWD